MDFVARPSVETWRRSGISGMNTSHRLAFFGAAFARIGAPLAVIHLVLAAFLTASAANVRAQSAELFRELRITGHELSREHANISAVPVEPDSTFHHINVVFLQTGRRAVFAFLSAFQARLDTTSVFFVSHNFSFHEDRTQSCEFNVQSEKIVSRTYRASMYG